MASGPCLRRCRVVRRYMPIRLPFYRLDVKSYPSMHVSMYFESFWEGNAVNTGVPCLKVPMHRKLRLEGDIRACFDELSHEWLLTHIPMDKGILRKWLKAGYMEGNVLHPTEAGTPQGGIASPVIANLALDGLEACLRAAFPRYVWQGGQRTCPKVNLIRLADGTPVQA